MKHKIARFFYPYGAARRVWRGPLRGCQFHVAPGFGLTYAFASSALHLDILAQLVDPGMTVLDIGANRGLISLLLSIHAGREGKVIAFEPITELHADFTANMQLNRVSNVELVGAAVSQETGETMMEYAPEKSTQGKIQMAEHELTVAHSGVIKVRTVALDDYVEAERICPDMIKIDVEGAAGFVLAGAGKVLSQIRPILFVELHGPDEQVAVDDAIRDYGYRAFDTDGKYIESVVHGWHSPIICRPK
ncbi:MAG: FkbM family methyltransferase [Planctomycetota bacterium]|nr:FkbM family methyltransferase [Planctomycetota bacterium]